MTALAHRLREVRNFRELRACLEEELDWPLNDASEEEVSFEYDPTELGLRNEHVAKVRKILQLRPLQHGQPWGIFYVEFDRKRLPVVVMRRILGQLVIKKRTAAGKAKAAAWNAEDLLFISSFGGDGTPREVAFAHFHESPGELPALRVLGWDGSDTPLKLEYVAEQLKSRLRWPKQGESADAWRTRWGSVFRHGVAHSIRTADSLAERLAELARGIRDRALTILEAEAENGRLTKLHKAFQETLLHDLDEKSFADTYAQTITYGLLTAAITRDQDAPPSSVADAMVALVPVTNPFLKEMLATFLKVGGRKGAINFDELGVQDVVSLLRSDETDLPAILRDFGNRTRGEDPVIHFYEHFLSAYDNELKVKRGVFYTPQPVVSYIVRSVDELLREEFGIEDGLASTTTWGEVAKRDRGVRIPKGVSPSDPFVEILDPATGTATFLVEVIDVIHETLRERWRRERLSSTQQAQEWNEYVPKHLLPRLHGYELMMAPYAIAHMKIGLKLRETGYDFASDERARVYLTNALDPPQDFSERLAFDVPALAHEAQAVNEVKRQQRFTVVVGNPPYSLLSANLETVHRELVERYKFIDGRRMEERGALQMEKILNDDYVKFLSLAERTLLTSGVGLLGMITNHAYLDNPTMRGMRHHFLSSFSKLWLLDLGGSAKKAKDLSTDENVFDIQQGVCISVFAMCARVPPDTAVMHGVLTGTRESKYIALSSCALDLSNSPLNPQPELFLFVPADLELWGEYKNFYALDELFPLHSIGAFTSKDHFVIGYDPAKIADNARRFRDSKLGDAALCRELELNAKKAWNVSRSRTQIRELSDKEVRKRIVPFPHRPFDNKYLFYHRSLVWSMAYPVNKNMLAGDNLALVTSRQLAAPPWKHAYCSNTVVEMFYISNKTKEGNHVFPLFLADGGGDDDDTGQSELALAGGRRANVGRSIVEPWSKILGLVWVGAGRGDLKRTWGPLALFEYVYAVLHSETYRLRYQEFLMRSFARIPPAKSALVLRELSALGRDLVSLHLPVPPGQAMTAPPRGIAEFHGARGPRGSSVGRGFPRYDAGAVKVSEEAWFANVPESVWEWRVGVYQPCKKWLSDRAGEGSLGAHDIAVYQHMVSVILRTLSICTRIDLLIREHGGWPGAFQQADEAGAYPTAREPEILMAADPAKPSKPRR